jgi:hypothetical protein
MHREWLEPALSRELGVVPAPEELWEKIQHPGPPKPSVHTSVNAARMSACATVVVLLLSLWLYPWRHELRSGDAGEIRAWVRANAGVDVPLRSNLPAELQLVGATVVKGRAEIAYRVHSRECLVANRKQASGHRFSLSCTRPDDLKIGCSLCHIG